MSKLYIITLEPLEQRYTKQWYKYFKEEFGKYFDVVYIDGTKTSDKIASGRFLDINKTNIWKADQIKKIAEYFVRGEIKDDDKFFFADAWHYGITAVKYMIQLNGLKCKIFGYFHAGTYDENDFIAQMGLKYWARYNELGWFRALDYSFVATYFHKELILSVFRGYIHKTKIKVVGFPMDWKREINRLVLDKDMTKEDLIVFPHRINKEKQPEVFDKLAKEMPKYKFVKTLEVTKNKEEYYNLIKKAKIVFSANLQETYGIGTVEAVMMGALPVVPDRLTYKEMYYPMFRYKTERQMKCMIKKFIENYNDVSLQNMIAKNRKRLYVESLNSIQKMTKVMLK